MYVLEPVGLADVMLVEWDVGLYILLASKDLLVSSLATDS